MWKLGWNRSSLHTCFVSFLYVWSRTWLETKTTHVICIFSITLHMTCDSAAVFSVRVNNRPQAQRRHRAIMQVNSPSCCWRALVAAPSLASHPSKHPGKNKTKQNKKFKTIWKWKEIKMCTPSESHRGGRGGELGVGKGVMDISCYWSTVSIEKKKFFQSVVIVLEIRQMYSELYWFFVALEGTKRLWKQCSNATLRKVCCLVASAVEDRSWFKAQWLRKDHICTSATVRKLLYSWQCGPNEGDLRVC